MIILNVYILNSQEDIENFKAEIEKRQLAEESETVEHNGSKPAEVTEGS